MVNSKANSLFFDSAYRVEEQLPRKFAVLFEEFYDNGKSKVKVILDGNKQVGDVISDNSYVNDFYRYHDIFHYSFATLLGWSPCTRALIRCKRKSNALIDEVEDGARAAITEEAISMVIFNEAARKKYFEDAKHVSRTTLRIIKEMTENFEVKVRSSKDWEHTILKSYEIFRSLVNNKGGLVDFDAENKEITYSCPNK